MRNHQSNIHFQSPSPFYSLQRKGGTVFASTQHWWVVEGEGSSILDQLCAEGESAQDHLSWHTGSWPPLQWHGSHFTPQVGCQTCWMDMLILLFKLPFKYQFSVTNTVSVFQFDWILNSSEYFLDTLVDSRNKKLECSMIGVKQHEGPFSFCGISCEAVGWISVKLGGLITCLELVMLIQFMKWFYWPSVTNCGSEGRVTEIITMRSSA